MRWVAGLALVGEVVPRIVRAAREYQTMPETLLSLKIFNLNRVVTFRAVAPKLGSKRAQDSRVFEVDYGAAGRSMHTAPPVGV